jgi:hypothetical protein
LVVLTRSTIARLAGPSFHEGRGSAATGSVVPEAHIVRVEAMLPRTRRQRKSERRRERARNAGTSIVAR